MPTHQVHLAIYDGLADWEVGHLTAALGTPRYQPGPERFEVVTVGQTAAPVRTLGGLAITPDRTTDGLDPAASAMLVLPGAPGWDAGTLDAAHWTDLARAYLAARTPVAAICGATFGLAGAGLLDDRDHTSGALPYLAAAPGYDGAAHYRDEDAVNDGDGLVTAGPAHPVAFARAAIQELGGFAPEALDAWHGLHTTGDPAYFFALQQATA